LTVTAVRFQVTPIPEISDAADGHVKEPGVVVTAVPLKVWGLPAQEVSGVWKVDALPANAATSNKLNTSVNVFIEPPNFEILDYCTHTRRNLETGIYMSR